MKTTNTILILGFSAIIGFLYYNNLSESEKKALFETKTETTTRETYELIERLKKNHNLPNQFKEGNGIILNKEWINKNK